LNKDCQHIFKKNGTLTKVCDDVTAGIIEFFPQFMKEIDTLAWDSVQLCNIAGYCKAECCDRAYGGRVPEQLHLALTAESTEMRVHWTTLNQTAEHVVIWGTEPDKLVETSLPGNSSTYTQFGWVGRLHHATMTGLLPGKSYFYSVGDRSVAGGNGMSPPIQFKTLQAGAGTAAGVPLRILSVGDMGYANNSDATVARMAALVEDGAIDMVIHNGDISYADGEMVHWDVFMRKVQRVASRVPYMVTPGNHEFWFNFTAYKHRFVMPDNGVHDSMYYSYGVAASSSGGALATGAAGRAAPSMAGPLDGGVHFVAMSTESPVDTALISKEQASFIKSEMANTGAPRWRIAFGHRPLYCSTTRGSDLQPGKLVLQKAIESTLVDAKVDVVIQAHVHDYERTYPMKYNESTASDYNSPTAPVYVLNGAAGNREAEALPPGGMPWSPKDQNYTRFVSFGLVTITADALKWEQIVSADGSTQDSWTITKPSV